MEFDERLKTLKSRLFQPRLEFQNSIKQAIEIAGGGEIAIALSNISRAVEARSPTPREISLVRAILDQPGERSNNRKIFSCIRCGAPAGKIASVFAGFSCCGSCWLYLDGVSPEMRKLDIDIAVGHETELETGESTVGDMDGVELSPIKSTTHG